MEFLVSAVAGMCRETMCIGYMMQCSVKDLLPVMAAALVFHGIGVVYGSRNAVKINQILLKKGIAVFSILIAIWKLAL